MNILLIGSGGREHALAWKLAQSSRCTKLFCAPGNPGIADHAECAPVAVDDIDGLVDFAKKNAIDLVVPGPELSLVLGLGDAMRAAGIKIFGPSKEAAQLEGSKAFMKDLCARHNIPTAAYGTFADIAGAKAFIHEHGAPIVVKADGLAAGKGVIIAQTVEEAESAVEDMLSGNAFGDSGSTVVIEEFMDGEELSWFALSDGKTVLPLTSAQDHKRAFDGDEGPNTGGMGAYSPAHMMTPDLERQIQDTIVQPVIDGMASEGYPFAGVLFAGIMLVNGVPKLLEINVRFGDPECQALMMRLDADLIEILDAAAEERLAEVVHTVAWRDETALCVVMAAKGYPGAYRKGTPIRNIDQAAALPDVQVFHAGTARDENGGLVSAGGRVLGVAAFGATVQEAQKKAYAAVDTIDWPDGFCRRDIGGRALCESSLRACG